MALIPTLSSPPSPNPICDSDGDGFGVDYNCSPHHIQAQRLNNTAATCIEKNSGNGVGRQQQNYEKAVKFLTKALRICEREQDQEHEHAYDVCSCHYCTIDSCIVLSSVKLDDHDLNNDNDNDNDDCANDIINEENNDDGTTIYQNPIYVFEGHNMGSALIQVITFNLGIIHHLTSMMANNNNNNNDNENEINKALQFYELAYECNLSNSNTYSIHFDTIICNNLSHIYRYQEQKEEQCEVKQQHQQENQQQQPILITDEDDREDDNDESSSSLDSDDLLELEYYSQKEEQEEYEHNAAFVSLLTTISTTLSPLFTVHDVGSTTNCCSGCSSSSPLLLKQQQNQQRKGGGVDLIVSTTGHDSIIPLYTTCVV